MIHDLKTHVRDVRDREAVENYLEKLLDREAFDARGSFMVWDMLSIPSLIRVH